MLSLMHYLALASTTAGFYAPPAIRRPYDHATTPETEAKLESARKTGEWERIRKAKEKRERRGVPTDPRWMKDY